MRVWAVAGQGPSSLGGIWRPLAWMPAIDVIRDRLAAEAQAGPLTVRTTLEAGFPLMAAAACLIGRDAGLPLKLEVVVPFPLPDTVEEPRAVHEWAQRALARADARQTLFARPPRSRPEVAAVRQETERTLLGGAELVLACWNGRPGNRTWAMLQTAHVRGLPVSNLFPQIAAALGLEAPPAAGHAVRDDVAETG
ncbi:MAG: hypothetical protein VKP62_12395 [Candidatus Sericytochromatia bacterium]|nr:hypothetical protein [Candidatus Sericytochromatia bacterium]